MKYFCLYPIVIIMLIAFKPHTVKAQQDNDFEISKNIEVFTSMYKELNKNYVDDITPAKAIEDGIDAMLQNLDPYTVYIPESEVEDFRFITTGQYGGIGAVIQKMDDFVVIAEPYEGFPAQKSGLLPGDKILMIDKTNMKGKNVNDVSKLLKGQEGTPIMLTIERPGISTNIKVEVTREKIQIDDVPYYGMLDENTGYIKLTGFTQYAARDVRRALSKLKENNNLNGLVFDLRNNGGGLLNQAVNITNLFVPKGEIVVKTKGKLKSSNRTHKTSSAPMAPKIPLVILVNGNSASASEIVTGAIQDLDRGIVMGQRTFGKGLVQNIIPIQYNNQLKVTVAKYYIPSGRCIQAIDYSQKNEDGEWKKTPDSLATEFKTKRGRIVYDRGGIEPDIAIDKIKMSDVTWNLYAKHFFFKYANIYFSQHDSIDEPEQFSISDEIYNDFMNYVKEHKFSFETESEKILLKLKDKAIEEHYFNAIELAYNQLQTQMILDKEKDLLKHKKEIKLMLKTEIVTRYYHQKGRIRSNLQEDPEIEDAIQILNNIERYTAILNGTDKTQRAQDQNAQQTIEKI